MQDKNYLDWHFRKAKLHSIKTYPYFSEKEIWFCGMGLNIGYEQDGAGPNYTRPIIVFRKFNNSMFWAIPLTRTNKISPFHFSFSLNSHISCAILSQLRLVDARRLENKIGKVSEKDFVLLKEKLKVLLP